LLEYGHFLFFVFFRGLFRIRRYCLASLVFRRRKRSRSLSPHGRWRIPSRVNLGRLTEGLLLLRSLAYAIPLAAWCEHFLLSNAKVLFIGIQSSLLARLLNGFKVQRGRLGLREPREGIFNQGRTVPVVDLIVASPGFDL